MKIILIDNSNMEKGGGLVPPEILRDRGLIFACRQDGETVGLLAMSQKDVEWSITWLYVKEANRGQGAGKALLDAAIGHAQKKGGRILTIVYDRLLPDEVELSAFLAGQAFLLQLECQPKIVISRKQLQQASFLKNKPRLSSHDAKIVTLNDVENRQLNAFIQKSESVGNYLASHADLTAADARRSMAVIAGDKIRALLLVEHTEEFGTLTIPLFYSDKNYLNETVNMLGTAATEALDDPVVNLQRLEFTCLEPSVQRFADSLFPEKEVEYSELMHGDRLI